MLVGPRGTIKACGQGRAPPGWAQDGRLWQGQGQVRSLQCV